MINREWRDSGAGELRGSGLFYHLQTGPVLFPSLVYRNNRTSQRCQLPEFLLDVLQPFMPLAVRDLIECSITFLTPILFILLVDLGNFRSQTHDLFLKYTEMIHVLRIYQSSRSPRKKSRFADRLIGEACSGQILWLGIDFTRGFRLSFAQLFTAEG